jgi:hypothetical protein
MTKKPKSKPKKKPHKRLPRAGRLHVVRVVVRQRRTKQPVVVPALVPEQYVRTLAVEPVLNVEVVGPLLKAWGHVKDFFAEMQEPPFDVNRRK